MKIITLFNNKGGVSKTTTAFYLGWMLAEKGKRVILADADPQCNLTGLTIDLSSSGSLENFYANHPGQNIRDALEPAFSSRPKAVEAVECIPVDGREGLHLIPGHVGLAEDEVSLGVAQQLSETLQPLKNLPGSFRHLFNETAEKYNADYVIVDLSPGLGAINQNLVMTADYFIMPASPDIFSLMAIESLSRTLPKWKRWAASAAEIEALVNADYPFPTPDIKFLGTIVQRYRLRSGTPTEGFQELIDGIDEAVSEILMPALRQCEMALPEDAYSDSGVADNYRLASVSDFNTLIADAQRVGKPVFTLTQSDTGKQGFVWDRQSESIANFREIYERFADKVIALTTP